MKWIKTDVLLALTVLFSVAAPARAQQTVGLFQNDPGSLRGYTLFAPLQGTTTYLINHRGKLVNSWQSDYRPGAVTYLLDNGNLLRTGIYDPTGQAPASGGGGGIIEEFDWDGNRVWFYEYSTDLVRQHHDIEKMPNGNVLILAWEVKTRLEAIAEGRDPGHISGSEIWPEHVIEVEPSPGSGGTIVWEWHVWDHLVQEFDISKNNFGVVADHPELIDINYGTNGADWMHANSIDYNPDLDQIVISSNRFSEIWVIDHSTTTAEAATGSGGTWGKGGDLLYRWGNPQTYNRGTAADQQFFQQHDAQWIRPGFPGAGNLLVFNNGVARPGGPYSSVDELAAPTDENGNYVIEAGAPFGPASPSWSYVADVPTDFYASYISGAERLSNGNTLVCDGPSGTFFEVTDKGDMVWRYVSPVASDGMPVMQGLPAVGNAVFRAYRFPDSFPGLVGQDLTPADPIESFDKPFPAPDGTGSGEGIMVARGVNGRLDLTWDAGDCSAEDYNLLVGPLAEVGSYQLQSAVCGVGTDGSHSWPPPGGNVYFLLVGVDETGVYESSWGRDSAGAERNGAAPSNRCLARTKDLTHAVCQSL